MNLEERYNNAGQNTYVGRVRARQASDAGTGPGVNFLDGDTRGTWAPGQEAAPDTMQAEFTRNDAGDFRYGGGGKEPGSGDSYLLSRWLEKSLKIAFDGVGPSRLPTGYWQNSRFTTVNNVRNGNVKVHNWAPVAGKAFDEAAILSEFSRGTLIRGSAVGPTPAGLNG
jgi:hypothetical protein